MKRIVALLIFTSCLFSILSGCGTGIQDNPVGTTVSEQMTDTTRPQENTPSTGVDNASEKTEAQAGASTEETGGTTNSTQAPASPVVPDSSPAAGNETGSERVPEQNTPPAQTQQPPEISQITVLETGFSSASFSGEDGFEEFLSQGGASSDSQVAQFLSDRLAAELTLESGSFGCSTLAVSSPDGHRLFGRNFDWQNCSAMVVTSHPADGYASISTVNMDFISRSGLPASAMEQNDVRVMAALYAPLDGMNEKGLAVSVNMIQDAATINQNTDKPDLTTTTAIRLLLNKAANVEEALTLLRQYDLHSSMGMMIHFALADTTGRSVVVEYINNQMVVTDTPVVTNFYLAEGSKHGIGTEQSHTRYEILSDTLAEQATMDMDGVRDALDSVSKDNFGEFESTEWSAVFDLSTGTAHYYHRENYSSRFTFSIE